MIRNVNLLICIIVFFQSIINGNLLRMEASIDITVNDDHKHDDHRHDAHRHDDHRLDDHKLDDHKLNDLIHDVYSHDDHDNDQINHRIKVFKKDIKFDYCNLSEALKREIKSYQPIVNKIMTTAVNGSAKGKVYNELAKFVDTFGSRLSGTENLEQSFDYLTGLLNDYKLENIHNEPVLVPNWVRGNEWAVMMHPRYEKLNILGLGGSIATPPEGITAQVLVVNSFDELREKSNEAQGKIVVFNQEFISYPVSVEYRTRGASEAGKVGALAALIRSVTPLSISSPHTGYQNYENGVRKIPVASITVELAEMLRRISERGEKIYIKLYMEAKTLPDKMSRNLVGELRGLTKPEKVVVVSGHVDSWDVGEGAMDDAAGAFVSWYSVALLKSLDLRPKRTIRAIMWTAEEVGLIGARQYVKAHAKELKSFNLVMESDEGTFTPNGIEFTGSESAACILQEISKLMRPLKADNFKTSADVGSDITEFFKFGVPGATVSNKNDRYFWFHHTDGDMMTVENSEDLDKNVAMYAALAYIVANLSQDLPRGNSSLHESNAII